MALEETPQPTVGGMRCSTCGKVVRPVIAFDGDGTLGEYHRTFGWFAARYWDLFHLDPISFARIKELDWDGSGEFEDYLGLTKAQYREAKQAYRQSGAKRWMHPYPGAPELVAAMRDLNVEVWFATTRPWNQYGNIDPDTREWHRRSGMNFDGLLYGDDKYRQLLENVDLQRVVGVVDDLAEQCMIASGLGLPVLQVARPHNEAAQHSTRTTMQQLPAVLTERVIGWYAAMTQGDHQHA